MAAIGTLYSIDELYSSYRNQYIKSEAQLGEGVLPKLEMYSKKQFEQDWAAIKAANKGLSGIRVAEKLARSNVYRYSIKQAESLYGAIYTEEREASTKLKEKISTLKGKIDRVKSEEKRIALGLELKALEKEEKRLRKQVTAYTYRIRRTGLSEEEAGQLDELYDSMEDEYWKLRKEQKMTGKQAKAEIARKYFSWYYV